MATTAVVTKNASIGRILSRKKTAPEGAAELEATGEESVVASGMRGHETDRPSACTPFPILRRQRRYSRNSDAKPPVHVA